MSVSESAVLPASSIASGSTSAGSPQGNSGYRFIDSVSHEFRTPLSVIKEYSSLLGEGLLGDLNEEQLEFVTIVGDRADDLCNLVDDLMDSVRAEAGMVAAQRRPTPIADILERVEESIRHKTTVRGISLVMVLPDSLPAIYCDPGQAGRVLFNLVVNGIKYTDTGGEIRITGRPSADGHAVCIAVKDSGRGFREEDARNISNRLQNPHERPETRTKGFGLALNIANALVDQCFGQMQLDSVQGDGNTFSFSMPVAEFPALCHCYLSRLQRMYGADCPVACLSISTGTPVDDSQSAQLHAHIEALSGTGNLVWRVAAGDWVVLAAGAAVDTAGLNAALHSAVQTSMEERPELTLPLPAATLLETSPCSDAGLVLRVLEKM